MKVKELIENLQWANPEAEIGFRKPVATGGIIYASDTFGHIVITILNKDKVVLEIEEQPKAPIS
jgi:hypothetical protein